MYIRLLPVIFYKLYHQKYNENIHKHNDNYFYRIKID